MLVAAADLVAKSCPTLCDPVNCSPPGSSVHGFPRQEYWSGLPFPSPDDHPDPAFEPMSPASQADSLPLSHRGSILEFFFSFFPCPFYLVLYKKLWDPQSGVEPRWSGPLV